jgi:hypothetical protein
LARHEFKTKQYLVVVGWDDGLQTFFGQVWALPDGDDTDGPPEFWVGASWEEVPTPEALAEALCPYATIPQRLRKALEHDYRRRRPLCPWQEDPKARLFLSRPKGTA